MSYSKCLQFSEMITPTLKTKEYGLKKMADQSTRTTGSTDNLNT